MPRDWFGTGSSGPRKLRSYVGWKRSVAEEQCRLRGLPLNPGGKYAHRDALAEACKRFDEGEQQQQPNTQALPSMDQSQQVAAPPAPPAPAAGAKRSRSRSVRRAAPTTICDIDFFAGSELLPRQEEEPVLPTPDSDDGEAEIIDADADPEVQAGASADEPSARQQAAHQKIGDYSVSRLMGLQLKYPALRWSESTEQPAIFCNVCKHSFTVEGKNLNTALSRHRNKCAMAVPPAGVGAALEQQATRQQKEAQAACESELREIARIIVSATVFLLARNIALQHVGPTIELFVALLQHQVMSAWLERRPGDATTTYTSEMSIREWLGCVGSVIREDLVTRVQQSKFVSIAVDGTTDISRNEQVSVCLRWLENGSPVEALLHIGQLSDRTASGYRQFVLAALRACGLRFVDEQEQAGDDGAGNAKVLQRLACTSLDGASAMRGQYSGLAVQISFALAPSCLRLWCSAHCLALAAADSAAAAPPVATVLGLVRSLWVFFRGHHSHLAGLRESLAEAYDMFLGVDTSGSEFWPEEVQTRWLSRGACVHRVWKQLPAVCAYLSSPACVGIAETQALLNGVKDAGFWAGLSLLDQVCTLLDTFSRILQDPTTTILCLISKFDLLYSDLQRLTDDPTACGGDYSEFATFYSVANGKPLRGDAFALFHSRVATAYLREVLAALDKRFAGLNQLRPFAIFNTNAHRQDAAYGENELAQLHAHWCRPQTAEWLERKNDGDTLHRRTTPPVCDATLGTLQVEWRRLRALLASRREPRWEGEGLAISLARELADTFPALSTLASIALVAQPTSVACERAFSKLGITKTKSRNRLADETLNNLLLLQQHGGDITPEQLERVVQKFAALKTRRVDLIAGLSS